MLYRSLSLVITRDKQGCLMISQHERKIIKKLSACQENQWSKIVWLRTYSDMVWSLMARWVSVIIYNLNFHPKVLAFLITECPRRMGDVDAFTTMPICNIISSLIRRSPCLKHGIKQLSNKMSFTEQISKISYLEGMVRRGSWEAEDVSIHCCDNQIKIIPTIYIVCQDHAISATKWFVHVIWGQYDRNKIHGKYETE